MRRFLFCLVIGLSLAGNLLAQHAGDIELEVLGNKIVTGERVYGVEFGVDSTYTASEPGFDSLGGTFPFPSSVGFNILGQLKVWDGMDFDAVAVPRIKAITPVSPFMINALSPASNSTELGFNLNVAADGSWHRHLTYELVDAAGTSLTEMPIQFSGIYLLTLELKSNAPGIGNSDPFYLVFNNNDSEANHDAAISFVQASVVPEPGTWAALTMAGLATAFFVKRRRQVA